MFIWLFHRISGVALIVLFGLKLVSGYFLYTGGAKPDLALLLHTHKVVDVLIIVLFTFHSIYGVRTIIMDFGVRKEKLLFWVSTLTASVLSVVFLAMYFVKLQS